MFACSHFCCSITYSTAGREAPEPSSLSLAWNVPITPELVVSRSSAYSTLFFHGPQNNHNTAMDANLT